MPHLNLVALRREITEPIAASGVIALLVVSGILTFLNIRRLWDRAQSVDHTRQVLNAVSDVDSFVKDAETSGRGFIITGEETYLGPYRDGLAQIPASLSQLMELTDDNPPQLENVRQLQTLIERRMQTLDGTIELRRTAGFDLARARIMEGSGKQQMEAVREQVGKMRQIEVDLYEERELSATSTYQTALTATVVSSLAGVALLGTVLHLNRRRRQRAEHDAASIFQERERLQVTLASIGDGVISSDKNGNVTYLNAVAETLTGWSNEEAQGQSLASVFKIVNEDTRNAVENPAARVLRAEAIVGMADHTLLIARQGRETPIDNNAALIRTASGKIDGVVLVFRDVTQRRDEDRRLREAAEFTRSIVDGLNELVIVLDNDRRVLNTNRAFKEAFASSQTETTGVPIHELADGQLNLGEIQSLLEQVANDDSRSHSIEFEHHFERVGHRVLQVDATRFNAGQKLSNCILLVLSDVTDERQLQETNRRLDQQMRWFLEQIQDYAIFMIDTDFKASSWNQGVEQVLGFGEDEFLGQDIRPLIFTPEANESGVVAIEFATAAKTGHASDDRWMMRKGGRRFWASGITGAVRDDDGNLVGYSKVMRDLTLWKTAQDDLTELAAKLSEESRRKNEFLATLAHELRNPLAPIKNAVQLMGMSQLDGDVEELRETMARQVEQLVRLIDDLLDVSRISRGKISLRKEVVDLHAIIDAAVEASTGFIQENGQELSVKLASDGLKVEADPARLAQVFSNLLNNSAKYSNPGCKIELTADVEDQMAVVRVRDNGIGIAPDRLEEIFQMFSQVDNSLERGTAGLGIGLTLVKTLIELHNGTVVAESDGVGHGSTFTVRLPITNKSQLIDEIGTPETESLPEKSFRVLVVEDMRALSMVMGRLLRKLGHEVEIVDNGQAALEKLNHWTADLIFSDISMPGMTGYELAQRLRQREDTASIFLVAMTGYGQTADRDKALQSGFDRHLVKPVDVRQLQIVFAELANRAAS